MKISDTMHPAQVAVLHVLLFRPQATFAELRKTARLSSDHFNFHLKKMLAQNVIKKASGGYYELTATGKEYANRFDTDARTVERQPKTAVLLLVEHADGRMLCQQRLKQPFYGFWGRPTGKVRWGETILQAAARELAEETNLTADLELKEIYHKLDFDEATNALLEDKIFYVVHATNPQGELLEKFEGGRNAWMTLHEVLAEELVFEGIEQAFETIRRSGLEFTERRHFYNSKDY